MRITLLLTGLAVAATLNHWSRQGDPRFYAFLHSPLGAECARVFGWWSSPLEMPVPEKADHRLTAEERRVKASMTRDLGHAVDAPEASYRVTYRDVAFRLEYANDPLYLYPPYAIISELPATEMDRTMTEVGDVFDGFRAIFGPLCTQTPDDELIHLLYFGSESSYQDYQQRYADTMENTSGFYSPARNRLVLYRDPGLDPTQSLLTIRHEAAHQLFYTYGIHSRHRVENDWLVEGLASYCETSQVGGTDPDQLRLLENALGGERLIPIAELVNHRSDRGLMAYKPAELAYAQSWCLVHFLMQQERRDLFFDYIRFVRAPESFPDLRERTRVEALCRHLGMTPDELQAAWENHLVELASMCHATG